MAISAERQGRAIDLMRSFGLSSPLETIVVDGRRIALKMELFLPTRSFKVRGAFIAVDSYKEGRRPLVTASTGNFGAALAFAGRQLGVEVHVFVSRDTAQAKVDRMSDLGAEIQFSDSLDSSTVAAGRFADSRGARYVSAYNEECMILGGMTLYEEAVRQLGGIPPAGVYCPVGGGGLISGIVSAIDLKAHVVESVAVFPDSSTAYFNAVHDKRRPNTTESIADALVGGLEEESLTIDIGRRLVSRWESVSEWEIAKSMKWFLTESSVVAEGAGATGMAALRRDLELGVTAQGSTQLVVVSGGNVAYADFVATLDKFTR